MYFELKLFFNFHLYYFTFIDFSSKSTVSILMLNTISWETAPAITPQQAPVGDEYQKLRKLRKITDCTK